MENGYLELKLAWGLFEKAPEALGPAERQRVTDTAGRQAALEQRILASGETARVVIPAATLATRFAEIRQRYPAETEFARDLARIGCTLGGLEEAIERDLRIEAVLDSVAAGAPPVSDVEAEIYYRVHPEAFDRPEARRLRHILITFDNAPGKLAARQTLDTLRATLGNAERFGQAALRHSQCPTAMEGGKLGVVKRQQLYPELEPVAFALNAGEISPVLESPIGLHILRCDEILPSGMLAFAEVRRKIIEKLTEKRRREAQRAWIKALPATAPAPERQYAET